MKPPVILLVSKDPEVACMVEDETLAERHGFRHLVDHEIARRALGEGGEDVDLVILDLDPDIGGLSLFHYARRDLPMLVLTPYSAEDMLRVFRYRSPIGCLIKPFTKAQLHQAVHGALTKKAVAAGA
jgi:DNA-binding response OmpR family regulator